MCLVWLERPRLWQRRGFRALCKPTPSPLNAAAFAGRHWASWPRGREHLATHHRHQQRREQRLSRWQRLAGALGVLSRIPANTMQLDTTACIAAISTVGNGGEYITGSAARRLTLGLWIRKHGANHCSWKWWQLAVVIAS